jgi:hypothetical protein
MHVVMVSTSGHRVDGCVTSGFGPPLRPTFGRKWIHRLTAVRTRRGHDHGMVPSHRFTIGAVVLVLGATPALVLAYRPVSAAECS